MRPQQGKCHVRANEFLSDWTVGNRSCKFSKLIFVQSSQPYLQQRQPFSFPAQMSVARASNLVVGPSTHLRRLPIAESLTLLRTGPASIPLAPGVKSLRFRYVADTTGDPGCRLVHNLLHPCLRRLLLAYL